MRKGKGDDKDNTNESEPRKTCDRGRAAESTHSPEREEAKCTLKRLTTRSPSCSEQTRAGVPKKEKKKEKKEEKEKKKRSISAWN